MNKYIYMAVEHNEYELPIAVADTQAELARMMGIDNGTITHMRQRCEANGIWCPYLKIPVEGDYELPNADYTTYIPVHRKNNNAHAKKICMNDRVFNSLKEAAKVLNKTKSSISYYLKTGRDPLGNKWTYFNE